MDIEAFYMDRRTAKSDKTPLYYSFFGIITLLKALKIWYNRAYESHRFK